MSSQLSDISKYTNNAQKIMQAAEAALATMIKSEKELMDINLERLRQVCEEAEEVLRRHL